MPFATRNGVRLSYTDTGSGDPPLLFVHGWCCSKENWAEQVRAFRRSHRVVIVDLRGHGKSDKPVQDYTIDGFAEDLEWLIGELGLRKPVVIGHSMGGLIALTLARRRKRPLRGIVLVDASMHMSMSQPQIDGLLRGLAGSEYKTVAKIIVDNFFTPTTPKAMRTQLTKELLTTPQHVLSPAMNSLAATMRPEPMDIGIPSLFIDARREFDRLAMIESTIPDIEIARTVGAGHFNMMEAPDQVNAMLTTFLAQFGAKKR